MSDRDDRVALMLAGGGLKVAFQAGALQVLLDEAGLEFDLYDGASGGTLNLAMLCQGASGRRIADNWRRFSPLSVPQPNWRIVFGESIGRSGRLIANGFSQWGLDFEQIRQSSLDASFNVYDFARHEPVLLSPGDMTEELLAACVSLPAWFPPVKRDGATLIDPVYYTDCNVEEAIRRGARTLWVIWTVSRRGRWRWGFVNQYFQVIETAANGQFKRTLRRIDESNRALAEGRHAEFEHRIDYRIIYGEVPLHYLINVRRAPFRRAVEQGVEAARAACRREGIPLAGESPPPAKPPSTVRFREGMAGAVVLGESDPRPLPAVKTDATARLAFRIAIHVDDLDRFLAEPSHEATAAGVLDCPALGGRRVISDAWFNLFTEGGPGLLHMRYRLWFTDATGRPLTLLGVKDVHDDPGTDAWADTTTLFTRIAVGHVDEDGATDVVAAGILRLTVPGFARQLSTFRGTGPGPFGGLRAVLRFNRSFLGNLFRVYGLGLLGGG